jgi:hypothetical protein
MGADPKHGPPIRRLPQHFSQLCRLSHTSQRIQDGGPASAVRGPGNFKSHCFGKSDTTDTKLVLIPILLHCSDPPLTPLRC